MRRILDLLAALNDAGVDYVVVGGVAVVLRGHARMTVDLDLALDLTPDNLTAALDVLKAQGLVPRLPVAPEQFADPDIRRSWVEQRNLVASRCTTPRTPCARWTCWRPPRCRSPPCSRPRTSSMSTASRCASRRSSTWWP